ncbi:DUF3761 domain-containing protein [Mycobacterium marinum]|uniref:DUF3761 domain-containing protein n=1 Tax=Mycobacterium marinum TaxID=1781 RepID=UPI0035635E21
MSSDMKRVVLAVLAVAIVALAVVFVVVLVGNSDSSPPSPSPFVDRPTATVNAPSATVNQPPTVAAICNDGTAWSGRQRRGACSHHGGVKQWQAP